MSSQKTPDSDGDSDSTLDALDALDTRWTFGYPLERLGLVHQLDEEKDWISSLRELCSCSSPNSDGDNESVSSSVIYDINFEQLIDELCGKDLSSITDSRNLIIVELCSEDTPASIMIKCLPRTSTELLILLELNNKESRHDPWNPAPHIICAVERGDNVFLCMERLMEYNQPPFRTVANYIDFFRQVLEGLTFLHEHSITHMCCSDPGSLMMGIGIGTGASPIEHFDRTIYPVRYYFTDFSRATKMSSSGTATAFSSDIRGCAMMMTCLLANVPELKCRFKTFMKAMTSNELGADDCRKSFGVLCQSLESPVFDMPVPAID